MSETKFYCRCGMEVEHGSDVIKQIKHINGSYHKKRMRGDKK